MDCDLDTGRALEHYYLRLDIWLQAHNSKTGMLCIGCVETRLGRRLCPDDFTNATINNPKKVAMSDRLRTRITVADCNTPTKGATPNHEHHRNQDVLAHRHQA